jgi:hypothetical protein
MSFSNTSRVEKYAHKEHKKTVGQGRMLEKVRYFNKGDMEGLNEASTDYTKPQRSKEIEVLKPVQHPVNLDSEDSAIISHKVPPKNLTPYNHVPLEALVQLDLPCAESP